MLHFCLQKHFSYIHRAAMCLLALALLWAVVTPARAVPPLAGTEITNRAQVTFETDGQSVQLDSNIVSVLVQPVEDLTLNTDNEERQPPGETVYLPHRLTNTGNVTTAYSFELADLSGDDYDLTNLTLYRDTNGNGQPDAGE